MARPLNISLLESSFKVLAPQGELLVERSYQFLFDEYPQVKPLFINTDPKSQQKKLFVELSLVISNLITSDTLSAALQGYSKNSGAGTGDQSRFRRADRWGWSNYQCNAATRPGFPDKCSRVRSVNGSGASQSRSWASVDTSSAPIDESQFERF
jgi:hypothetical protein